MKSGKTICIALLLVIAVPVAMASGQYRHTDTRLSPRLLNYQGYLTDTLGNPISNSSLLLSFAIFDSPSGGIQKWTETQGSVSVDKGIFNVLLGSIMSIPDSVFTNSASRWLELTVAGQVLSPRTRIVSACYAYSATYSDTAFYARTSVPDNDWIYLVTDGADTTLQTGGRWGLARLGNTLYGNADSTHVNFGVACTTGLSGTNRKYCTVAGGRLNRASGLGATISGGYSNRADTSYATVGGGYRNTANGYMATVAGGYLNTASSLSGTVGGGWNNIASGDFGTVGGGTFNTANGGRSFVGGGWGNYNAGDYSVIAGGYADTITATGSHSFLFGINSNLTQDSTIMVDMPHTWFGTEATGYEFPRQRGLNGQVMVTNTIGQLSWAEPPSSSKWSVTDSVIYTNNIWGIARGYANNVLYGDSVFTHINFGVECTTGYSGHNYKHCIVSGGLWNMARNDYCTVGGGRGNWAQGFCSTIGGGWYNTIDTVPQYATIAGGCRNSINGSFSTIGGGYNNTGASAYIAVGGGQDNYANNSYGTIGGGKGNRTGNYYATVAGGDSNTASGYCSAVGGGAADTAYATCGFAANYHTYVLGGDNFSAAFTTSHTTAGGQVRATAFSTGTLCFTMDHPSDPKNKILNQYAMGSDEEILFYRGAVNIGADGRAIANLPDYFDKITSDPMIQLTGVGSSDVVFVAEDVKDNHFVIGGKPGMKVYWTVTAERRDIHAEIARVLTPVEQPKIGGLINHSLDDDALIGVYDKLNEKKPNFFKFKTDEGRGAHEQMKSMIKGNK